MDILLYGESLHGVCIGAYRQGTSYCLRYVVEHREGYAVPGEDKWWVKKVWITEKGSPRIFSKSVVGESYVVKHHYSEKRGDRYTILTNSPWRVVIPDTLWNYPVVYQRKK